MQHTTNKPPVIDITPRALADLLDGLLQGFIEEDREVALVLSSARDSLRTISWNRYAREMTRKSKAGTVRRRHQGQHSGLRVVSNA